jgi:hypothetical protein
MSDYSQVAFGMNMYSSDLHQNTLSRQLPEYMLSQVMKSSHKRTNSNEDISPVLADTSIEDQTAFFNE